MEYTYEELTGKSVHTLRNILRSIGGVPGVLDKKQLIDGIMSIQQGEKPRVRSPRGRKPIENAFIEGGEDNNELESLKFSDIPFGEKISVSGVVEICDGKYGFLRGEDCSFSNRNSYILLSTIKNFNLKNGDEIDAISERTRDTSVLTVSDVLSINGYSATIPLKRISYEELVPRYPTEKFTLSQDDGLLSEIELICPMGKGQRVLLTVDGDRYDIVVKNIVKAIEKSYADVEISSLLVGLKPEEIAEYNDLKGCKNTVIADCENESTLVRKIDLFFSRLRSFAESGVDVVAIVNSIDALVKFYDKKSSYKEEEENGIKTVKKFFSQSGNYENGGSVTVIAVLNKEEKEIYSKLSEIATCEISLTGCNKRGNFICLDYALSHTVKDELLLSEKEIAKADELRESKLKTL